MMIPRLSVALAATLCASAAFADATENLRPHRAVYDLKLMEASDRSGITSMNGRIVYEMTGSVCEGFSTRYRFLTDVRSRRKSFTNDQRSTSFESADGKSFNFVTQSYLNGQLEKDLRGEATATGSATEVRITKPEEQEVSLGKSLFMTQHIAKVIDAAKAGETFLTANVFDGSDDGDSLVETTAVIGKKKVDAEVKDETPSLGEKFSGEAGWPVSVSYFSTQEEPQSGEKLPVYQVSFMLHESGVSRGLVMRYADYSLKADLKEIEYLKAEPCD